MQRERGKVAEEMKGLQNDRRGRIQGEQIPPQQPQKCPRCESPNTKFCYYNNYSLSQPRYFCKTCRRYWTQGGTLRNVPVGGGCRKGKRSKRPSSSSSSSETHLQNPQSQQTYSISTSSSSFQDSLAITTIKTNETETTGSLACPSIYGGGFLASMVGFNSFNQAMNVDNFGGLQPTVTSNFSLPLMQGFSLPATQQQNFQGLSMGFDRPLHQLLKLEENPIQPVSVWNQQNLENSNSGMNGLKEMDLSRCSKIANVGMAFRINSKIDNVRSITNWSDH
ncbi:uncharacterized protein LOC143846426 [Tasmannia lanceolata]|uniref:uncharacterized protein LOC143846426 n=1 Tax=Tasmannia lanceolata TaxID=3420 RepID=UPI004063B7F4